ncbi:hypothetical protein C8Q77DRAFT_769201 [Trametes polyzona]|nr:hypothetical protein C8Q77DRAFT_769201 [Trametes polyzona]
MRLLDTETGYFVEIANPTDRPYAILSHTWDLEGEQKYQDVCAIQQTYQRRGLVHVLLAFLGRMILFVLGSWRARSITSAIPSAPPRGFVGRVLGTAEIWAATSPLQDPRLSRKIRGSCAHARLNGHRLLWIDSCCIDKTSSAELSEALNAMYRWYELATVCYAYLSDVGDGGAAGRVDVQEFERSRWHTRAWTLQELLAPDTVVFLSRDWRYLGTKLTLAALLYERLQIHPRVLTKHTALGTLCTAHLMSWAATRSARNDEDRAYCLMGIFDVHMPPVYGEGGQKAFTRLQEAIRTRRDPTVFAWNHASSPTCLEHLGGYTLDDTVQTAVVTQNSRIGSVYHYRSDFTSSLAAHPAQFLIGRLVFRIDRASYGQRLGRPELARHNFWAIPPSLAHDVLVCLPYVPLKACLTPETIAGLAPSMLNLFLAPLPCARHSSAQDAEGLLAIVCAESQSISPDAGTPGGPDVTKVLHAVWIHDRQGHTLRDGSAAPSSRIVLLAPEHLARCRDEVRTGGVLCRDPRASVALFRPPPLRIPPEDAGDEGVDPSVVLAPWCRSALTAEGFAIETLPLVIEGDEARLGYRLRRQGDETAVVIEYNPLHRDVFDMQLRFRIGLEELVVSPVVGDVEEAIRSTTTTTWTKWQVIGEGMGYTNSGCLDYPRSNGRPRSYIRVRLQYESQHRYMLGLDLVRFESVQT